jgi:uncharacterized protein YfkK (UPF0435 family)
MYSPVTVSGGIYTSFTVHTFPMSERTSSATTNGGILETDSYSMEHEENNTAIQRMKVKVQKDKNMSNTEQARLPFNN